MKTWGYFALAAVLFAGVGVYTLRTDSIEWWTVVTATVMFVAAATFASRAVVEYRNAGKQP